MTDCRKCAEFDWCVENEDCGLFKPKPQTNADKIRSMSDEELAEFNLRKRVEYQRGEIKRLGGELGPLLWACPVCKSYTRSPLAGGWNYCPTCGHVKRPLEERRTNGQEV